MKRSLLRSKLVLLLATVSLTSVTAPTTALAEDEKTMWKPEWRESSWADWGTTLATGFGGIAFQLWLDPPSDPNWDGPILLDAHARSAFRLTSRSARDDANLVSDIAWFSAMAYPVLVDTWIVALGIHGDAKLAGEMFAMQTQGMAAITFINSLLVKTIGRARPALDRCTSEGDAYSDICIGNERNQSMPSGHTALASAAAGLTCSIHSELDLYGDGPGGTIACLGTILLAATTGASRIASDRHWFSDVIVGGGLGFAVGYFLPKWLHFDWNDSDEGQYSIFPYSDGEAMGVGLLGTL
ncbi:MAG: membrane-associated phospholipid phosphatase [Myxococcota bacterium]|jgi:membrane-associated phospholipid phosphatase